MGTKNNALLGQESFSYNNKSRRRLCLERAPANTGTRARAAASKCVEIIYQKIPSAYGCFALVFPFSFPSFPFSSPLSPSLYFHFHFHFPFASPRRPDSGFPLLQDRGACCQQRPAIHVRRRLLLHLPAASNCASANSLGGSWSGDPLAILFTARDFEIEFDVPHFIKMESRDPWDMDEQR